MPSLTQLNLYPIKSCAGIALQKATVTSFGLMSEGVHDREWMVVNENGGFLTQREYPRMALITPCLRDGALALNAPGMTSLAITLSPPDPAHAPSYDVTVWDDICKADDCGDTAAAWFSQFIGIACRLVRFHPQAKRLVSSKWTGGKEVLTMFSDAFPMLLISEASLIDLNQKLAAQARAPLPMNRFRPNLVIGGIDAFEEDYAATIQVGGACLQPVKPCPRCPMPSIDQATGISGPDPLDILQTYRVNPKVDNGITFGMNMILLAGENQVLELGQEVEVELAF